MGVGHVIILKMFTSGENLLIKWFRCCIYMTFNPQIKVFPSCRNIEENQISYRLTCGCKPSYVFFFLQDWTLWSCSHTLTNALIDWFFHPAGHSGPTYTEQQAEEPTPKSKVPVAIPHPGWKAVMLLTWTRRDGDKPDGHMWESNSPTQTNWRLSESFEV